MSLGQCRLSGGGSRGLRRGRRSLGPCLLRMHLQRSAARWRGVYSGTKALGEEVLAGKPDLFLWRLRIPFNHVENPRNYLTKLMRYARLLEASNSLSELPEFVAATLACWEKRGPFG